MLSSLALVVVLVIDQFRTDELLRAQQHLNPAGIGLLVNQGLFYDDAHHTQFFNMTCPGHTSISTGAMPGLHGIMLNDDWDFEKGRSVYCVSDQEHKWLDADLDNQNPNIGTSPKRILTSTLGDEMKLEWGDDSKVVSVSLKDRSAIALGGHHPDLAYWHAAKSRIWTTSDFFLPSRKLPEWVVDFNKTHIEKKPTHEEEYESADQSISDLTDLAIAAAKVENLGHHKNPDILWVSYSTHDFVGHRTGDDSPELRATIAAEDKNIARLLTTLKKTLGGKKFIVALTADHGAGINTEFASKKYNIPGGKFDPSTVLEKLNGCLKPDHIRADDIYAMNVYLAKDTKDKFEARKKLKACFNSMTDGVWQSYTRDEIMTNQIPQTPWLKNLAASYNPLRGSDVIGVLNPYWNADNDRVVNHETPYDYDSWVPLAIWWQGIRKHNIHRRVEITSLAPTLARILTVRRPSGATSEYLTEVLDSTGN